MDSGLLELPTKLEAGETVPEELPAPEWFKRGEPEPDELRDPTWRVRIRPGDLGSWYGQFRVPKSKYYYPGTRVHMQFAQDGVAYHGVARIEGLHSSSADYRVFTFRNMGVLYEMT